MTRVSLPEEAPGLHKGYAFCQYEDLVSAPWSEPHKSTSSESHISTCLKYWRACPAHPRRRCWRQESAVYAKQLFENRTCLFGRLVRVRYSEQGNS